MIDIRSIRSLGNPLKMWFTQLGLSLMEGDEKLNRLVHMEDVPVEDVAKIPARFYWKLARTYGNALTLKISIGTDELYVQNGTLKISNLLAFRRKLKTGDIVGVLNVYFDLNKHCLAHQVLNLKEGIKATVIFQQKVLSGVLYEPIVSLDQRLKLSDDHEDAFFIDDKAKQVILVPELDIWVNGERLSIVGGSGLSQLEETLIPPPACASELQDMREFSELNIKWIRLDPPRLTPLHFNVRTNEALNGKEAEVLLDLLAFLKVNLSLMYLSDSTYHIFDGSYEVTFIGAGGSATVRLPGSMSQDDDYKDILHSGAAICYKDFWWVYGDERRALDRLSTLQSVIAQAFPVVDDDIPLVELLRTADKIHSLVREHWKSFFEGEIDKYFDKVRQISEFVATATRSYGEQIDALIKSLTSTMLGAVVTVVGSFIGALLSDKFNPIVLIIGLAVYSGYLAIFPGFIGMTNAWQYFSEIKERMHQQFGELKSRIPFADKKKWDSLGNQLGSSENRFKRWFCVTIVAYGTVCFLAFISIVFLLIL